ncbi:hypothetical protein N7522_006879 [Penicillium canescens]|nr:hypothetical protein N7522_006879 [Penicillium canescens]
MSRYRGAVPNVPVQPTANILSEKEHCRKSQKIKKNTVERLACAMQDHVLWLQKTILIGDEIFSPKRDPTQDPRMEDFRRAEGVAIRSNQNFAQEMSGEERLQSLTKFVLSIQSGENDTNDRNSSQFKGRCRRVTEFVKRQPKLSSASDANRAVNKGLKHLVFERVLKERLDDLELPNMCEAVSAILGLSIDDFNSLTLAQMPQLVDALVSEEFSIYLRADDKPQGEKWHILDVIRSINEWFTSLQTRYNSQYNTPDHSQGLNSESRRCSNEGVNTRI